MISTASGTSTNEVEGKATLTGSLVNVYPYGLWMPEEWLGIWGIAGFGTGTSDLTTVGGGIPEESLLSWLGAAGQRAELWSGGGVSLAAKSDGFVTGVRHSSYGSMPVSAHAWRARLLVEAGLESRPQDALLSGLVELGARLDGGDASASRTQASAWGSPAAGACCWCTRIRTSASGERARP